MPYNFDNLPSRCNTSFFGKWTRYPKDILPMWIADADFPAAPQIIAALHKKVEHGVLGYELPTKRSNEVVAARMKKLHNWDVDPDWVVYTAGVNNGYNIAARILCSPQKGYLIQTPVYNEFLDTEHKTGARQRVARLAKKIAGNRIIYEVDFDAFERGVKKSGMFLLCHPHNPVGKIYSRAELKRMAEICIENGVTMISDEIHSELLLGDAKFMPLAKVSREVEKRTITLISASKAFNVPGLACAFAIIPDEKIRKQFVQVAESMSFEVSTPGLTAAQVAFSGEADSWLRALRRYLAGNRDFALEFVEENLPGVRATKPDATYLLWLDCSQLKLKPSPYEFFLKHAKVALSDGARFGKGNERFARLNFGTSRKILEEGLKRMSKAINHR
ncbi:MAG: PatB family C-S lyase [Anaerolineales bacterium]|nr:PatB family C-S lyase [Anaerolineales bacterium]